MDVTTALARLPQTPIHPLRRIAWAVISAKELPDPSNAEKEVGYRVRPPEARIRRVASDEARRAVERLGLRRLGVFRQTTLMVSRLDTEVFVDDEGVVRLSSSTTFDAFDTFLDDGTCVLTWIRLSTPGAEGVLAETGEHGTGDFARDLETHRARVAKRGLAGRAPLQISGGEDYAALTKHYTLRELPLAIAARYAMLLCFAMVSCVLIAMALYAVTAAR